MEWLDGCYLTVMLTLSFYTRNMNMFSPIHKTEFVLSLDVSRELVQAFNEIKKD